MFHLPELTKSLKVGSMLKSTFHASFPSNPKLCVIECLREYEKRTSGFRPKDPSVPNRLLLSHIKPHKPISLATLGRWLDIISRAGISTDILIDLKPILLEELQLCPPLTWGSLFKIFQNWLIGLLILCLDVFITNRLINH